MTPAKHDVDTARAVSYELLPKVSRSFALAIEALPEPLRSYVCTAYLLCRIVDTIEDHPTLADKTAHFDQFDRNLLQIEQWDSLDFTLLETINPPQSWDDELMKQARPVFDLFHSYPQPVREILKRSVHEMSVGMRDYTARGGEAAITLKDASDLDRYCYYVAGTVGNLLTELFAHEFKIEDPGWLKAQKERGYHFAQGLQKVNIIKDVVADFKRGSVFMPQAWLAKFGLTKQDLVDGTRKPATEKLLRYFIAHTAEHLEKARDYILNLPSDQVGARLFCTWPYAMAVDTLILATSRTDLFSDTHQIKVSRPQMFKMMA
ncbi:MAG: squalene/phytoene synthase family protein, partial [Deltaproteobacteria bacterium]|nr:squalene/phytoene synthase family protein [Deltaproteobacteria bacterium]